MGDLSNNLHDNFTYLADELYFQEEFGDLDLNAILATDIGEQFGGEDPLDSTLKMPLQQANTTKVNPFPFVKPEHVDKIMHALNSDLPDIDIYNIIDDVAKGGQGDNNALINWFKDAWPDYRRTVVQYMKQVKSEHEKNPVHHVNDNSAALNCSPNFSINDQSAFYIQDQVVFDPHSVDNEFTPLITDSVPRDVPETEVLNQRSEEYSQVNRHAEFETIGQGNWYHSETHSHCNGKNCAISEMNPVTAVSFPFNSLTLHPNLQSCYEIILRDINGVVAANIDLKCLFSIVKNDKRGRPPLYENSSSPIRNDNKKKGALNKRKSDHKKRVALTIAFETENKEKNFYNSSFNEIKNSLEAHPEHGTACVVCSFKQNIQEIDNFISRMEIVNIKKFWTKDMTLREIIRRGVGSKNKKAVNSATYRKREKLLKENHQQMSELYKKLTHHLKIWKSLVYLCTTLPSAPERIAFEGPAANYSEIYNGSNIYGVNFGHKSATNSSQMMVEGNY